MKALDSGMVVIGHVRNRTHFGNENFNNGDIFTVMDPFYNSTTYSYDNINDVIAYALYKTLL